jgi:hypothetical protein
MPEEIQDKFMEDLSKFPKRQEADKGFKVAYEIFYIIATK